MRDVIVVGSGGGGAVVAKELAARGLDVLLLEAGGRDADPQRDWSRQENDANNIFTGYLRFGPSDRSRPAWLRELPQPCVLLQVAGVGGTTQHYFANSPRAMPGVFREYAKRDRAAYDRAHEFPFTYRELVPYYEWVEHTLPVQTAPMGTKDELFLHGAAGIGLPVQTGKDITCASHRPQENAILQPHGTAGRTSDATKLRYPTARGCTFCGSCFQGCVEPRGAPRNLAAKRSTDNSYMPMALTADKWHRGGRPATMIADAYATRIDTDRNGTRARGVTWREVVSGARHSEQATVVVLAAGAVETPRLWLNSKLPNPNRWVGRGLTDHHFDLVTGVFSRYTGSSRGPSSAARCDFPGRGSLIDVGLGPGLQAFLAGISTAGIAGIYQNGNPATLGADSVGRLAGPKVRDFMSAGIDRMLNILILTDDDVDPRNKVALSTELPADENGPIGQVKVGARTARTIANREFLARKAIQILRAAGATTVYRWDSAPILLHLHSSMRIGADPRNSVLDPTGEARYLSALYIADNSALPNSLGGPNPTLTTQALATRTAESIFTKYFAGDRWVLTEHPVTSIDHRVTAAVRALET